MYARLQELPKPAADLLISVGGDGTLLTAGRYAVQAGLPVLGVYFGTLGFLTELKVEELDAYAPRLRRGDFLVERRLVLEAKVGGTRYVALNEFVFREREQVRTSYLTVRVNQVLMEDIPADGVIVATPTGSTAYNLSAGGAILSPELRAFTLNFICPHLLTFRPIVLREEARVTLEARTDSQLVVDGQYSVRVEAGQKVEIGIHGRNFQLVRLKDQGFPAVIHRKLGWGKKEP